MTTRRGSAPAAKLARNSGSGLDGRTMLLTYLFLLMAAIQEISARIGRATRYGRRRECLPMAADFCDLKDGEIVAIWSCGPLGQFAIKSAFLLGLRMVCASAAAAVPVALIHTAAAVTAPAFMFIWGMARWRPGHHLHSRNDSPFEPAWSEMAVDRWRPRGRASLYPPHHDPLSMASNLPGWASSAYGIRTFEPWQA